MLTSIEFKAFLHYLFYLTFYSVKWAKLEYYVLLDMIVKLSLSP
jgi:hypothetical protein